MSKGKVYGGECGHQQAAQLFPRQVPLIHRNTRWYKTDAKLEKEGETL